MPYKTEFQRFTDGAMSWFEPVQVWVEPTQEEIEWQRQQEILDAKVAGLVSDMDQLVVDIKKALEGSKEKP